MSEEREMKMALIAMLPRGPIWKPKSNGDFDKFLNGMGANAQEVYEFLATLRTLREPNETAFLSDLEREYGIISNTTKSDSDRRNAVFAKRYAVAGTGSIDDLQDALDAAGFNLVVQHNYPVVDPDDYLAISFEMLAGDTLSQAGEPGAQAGFAGGEIIANGIWYDIQGPLVFVQAGETLAQAGEPTALAGNFTESLKVEFDDYDVTAEWEYWRHIFFIAGSFSEWIQIIKDWNMESPYLTNWLKGPYTNLKKIINVLVSGPTSVRELEVSASNNPDEQRASPPINIEDPNIIFRHRMYDPGDNNIKDLTFTYPGVNSGTPAVNLWTVYGKALTFDGSNDYIDLGSSAMAGLTTFTVCAIIKLTGTGTGGSLFSRRVGGSYHFELFVDSADDKLKFFDGTTLATIGTALGTTNYYFVGASVISGSSSSFIWHTDLSTAVTLTQTFTPTITDPGGITTKIGGTTQYFGGNILFSEAYTDAKVQNPWINDQVNRITLRLLADFSDWRENRIIDGNAEISGVTNWTVKNNAVLTKEVGSQYDGTKYLRVTKNVTAYPAAAQNVVMRKDYTHEVEGYARSQDGVSTPQIYLGDPGGSGVIKWTGTTSTSWQRFYFTHDYPLGGGENEFWFTMIGSTGIGVDYDEILFKIEPKATTPWVAQQLTDIVGNYDGVSVFTDNKYTQFGKGRKIDQLDGSFYPLLNSEIIPDDLGTVFALSCWVKTTDISNILFSARTSISTRWEYGIDGNGKPYFTDGTLTRVANTAVNDGKYHHLHLNVSPTTTRFFLDGVSDSSNFTISIVNSVTVPIKVMSSGFAYTTDPLVGRIISPRIYTNTLTTGQITAQYDSDVDVILKGSYAEQILESTINGPITVSAYAFSKAQAVNVPAIYVLNPITDEWEELDFGNRGVLENISNIALDGLKGVRLYDKFTATDAVQFQFIKTGDQIINRGQVLNQRREELRTLILDHKPLHSWCALIVEYI